MLTTHKPGSLVEFLRERYGVEVTANDQCVVEASEGACIRPTVGFAVAPHLAPPLVQSETWAPAGTTVATAHVNHCDLTVLEDDGENLAQARMEPGPIRLLPELLVRHPLPANVIDALRHVPIVSCKLQRLRLVSELRRRLYKALGLTTLGVAETMIPFQSSAVNTRHALRLERGLERMRAETHAAWQMASHRSLQCAVPNCSNVEVEWMLAVATTSSGAAEPFNYCRLAWLGDAAVLFATAAFLTRCLPSANMAGLRSQAGHLISNRHLGAVAEEPPFEVLTFLTTRPFSCRGGTSAVLQGAQTTQGGPKKKAADVLEALVGVAVLLGGSIGAARVLSATKWWDVTSDVAEGVLEFADVTSSSADDITALVQWVQWLGFAAMQFHASVWLMEKCPMFEKGRLSERRKAVLAGAVSTSGEPVDMLKILATRDKSSPKHLQFMAALAVGQASPSVDHLVGSACLVCDHLHNLWSVLERLWELVDRESMAL